MENEELRFEFDFDIDGVRSLRSSIQYLLDVWPGAPARPKEEQEFLWHMRDQCDRCILQYTFEMNSK